MGTDSSRDIVVFTVTVKQAGDYFSFKYLRRIYPLPFTLFLLTNIERNGCSLVVVSDLTDICLDGLGGS
jgi:hypothetical protein